MITALYPGSFDPVTHGHLDIATRASKIFDRLIIGVYARPQKELLFTVEERVKLMEEAVAHLPNVEVRAYSGLTVDFARAVGAKVIIRGLRMSADFELEFDMALMNKKLADDVETLCMMTAARYQFLSSSLLKEVAQLGGCLEEFVPKHVAVALRKKYFPLAEVKST
ncbi:MAG: pantetheine-phosphate adenylyltransferase [Chloroflexi bacterium]|nr:MAG: pantetheine-phosphate adenylyltransferase [Chloroflexota bacterium]